MHLLSERGKEGREGGRGVNGVKCESLDAKPVNLRKRRRREEKTAGESKKRAAPPPSKRLERSRGQFAGFLESYRLSREGKLSLNSQARKKKKQKRAERTTDRTRDTTRAAPPTSAWTAVGHVPSPSPPPATDRRQE